MNVFLPPPSVLQLFPLTKLEEPPSGTLALYFSSYLQMIQQDDVLRSQLAFLFRDLPVIWKSIFNICSAMPCLPLSSYLTSLILSKNLYAANVELAQDFLPFCIILCFNVQAQQFDLPYSLLFLHKVFSHSSITIFQTLQRHELLEQNLLHLPTNNALYPFLNYDITNVFIFRTVLPPL